MRSSRVRDDARRWKIVAPLAAPVIAVVVAGSAAPARADDGDGAGAAAKPRRDDAPADLFGLDRRPRKPPPSCADATRLACPRRDGTAPAAVETTLRTSYLRRLPIADAAADVAASLTLGASRDDAGLAWSGASSLDNRWLLDGAPIDDPYLGGLATRVPIDFVAAVRTRTAGFGARDRTGLGATIDVALREGGGDHRGEARAWIGAGREPTSPSRYRGEYRPFEARYDDFRTVSAVGVIDGPLSQWTDNDAWYVVGVAPTVSDRTLLQRAFRRVDADGGGVPDRGPDGSVTHELIADQSLAATAYSVPILARAGVRWGKHTLAGTALAHVGRAPTGRAVGDDTAVGVDNVSRDLDLVGTYRGAWSETTLTVQGAWHRAHNDQRALDPGGAALPAIGWNGIVPPIDDTIADLGDRLVRQGCTDGGDGDPYPFIENCPFAGTYWTGGPGLLHDTTQDRPSMSVELEHRAGEHLIAVGVDGEDARVELASEYTGGFQRQVLGTDFFVEERFVRLGVGPGFDDDCGGRPCDFLERVAIAYRTRQIAAYLQDTWRPDPRVAVEYGVRAQETSLGNFITLREVLPRIGASWDFIGGGRSRLFFGWSRHAQTIPAALGAAVYQHPTAMQVIELAGTTTTLDSGLQLAVDPQIAGARVDEALAGVELGLADAIRLGMTARQRHLGRAMEDELGALASAGARGGTPATRDFTEVATWLENAPDAKLGLRVGYAWSRLRGNWPGPYDPQSGYQLFTSPLFDNGPGFGQENATGLLPGDRPHRFFAEVALRGAWRGFAVEGGLRASAQSGRPIDARLGFNSSFAIPRGAGGRLPALTNANLHLGARRGRVSASIDVFNLFDRRAATAVDDRYASDDSQPIIGGDRGDLIWMKRDDFLSGDEGPDTARVNPRYGEATRFQAPLTAYLGVAVDL